MTEEVPPEGSEDDEEILSPEEAEARIEAFISTTDASGGPPTAELADAALEHVRAAWHELSRITGGQPNNKVLAMMLDVSRRARQIDPREPEYWITSATSSLLSGQIPAGKG